MGLESMHERDSLKISTTTAATKDIIPVASATLNTDSQDLQVTGGDDVAAGDEIQEPIRTAMPGGARRRIVFVEFCANLDSRIGRFAPPGVDVIRLTITDDLTKPAGLDKALGAINTPNAIVILFGALPCTGGSQWQRLNWHRGNADTR